MVSKFISLLLWAFLLSGCAGRPSTPSALDPRGPAAAAISEFWWVLFGLGTGVYLVVMAALLMGLFRSRQGAEHRPEERGRTAVVWGGLILPALILVIVYGFTLGALRATAQPETGDDLIIEITGRRWWWQVNYLNQQFETANEIHIPVGQPVQIKLASEEVIHSFWVPQLHGKMDAIPGRVNTFWLQADEPGAYWGLCAEFCGVQHAKMLFVVVAEPPEQFLAWMETQRRPAETPADEAAQRGEAVFLSAGCMNCHTVRGTHATGELGPDLTHLAGRRTLASGAVENSTANLAGWISDPHGIKPGNLMPPTALSGEDLNNLLAYLNSLE